MARPKARATLPRIEEQDPQDSPTLDEALRQALEGRWKGRRCARQNELTAQRAIDLLKATFGPSLRVSDVTTVMLKALVKHWQRPRDAVGPGAHKRSLGKPCTPATIQRYLITLSAMGIDCKGAWVRQERKPKWWLSQDAQLALTSALRAMPDQFPRGARRFPTNLTVADFVDFTVFTGLRVEESLRLTSRHFSTNGRGQMSITVPGTKTANSEATLPLGPEAQAFVVTLLDGVKARIEKGGRVAAETRLFPLSYTALISFWDKQCRPILGVEGVAGATPKALRRSAARRLHVQGGMPLDMLRRYLRHSDVNTTMGYLRLVGGYDEDEMRKYLGDDAAYHVPPALGQPVDSAPVTVQPVPPPVPANDAPQSRFTCAAVCTAGHVVASDLEAAPPQFGKFCRDCGSGVLSACPCCGGRVRVSAEPGGLSRLPNYCEDCGKPFPWQAGQTPAVKVGKAATRGREDRRTPRLSVRLKGHGVSMATP